MVILFELSGNWAACLVLLALLVRMIILPITQYSIKHQAISMGQQARIAPQLKDVKRDFNGVQQSEKIIELYERERYDHLAPFKSTFALLIQIPILVALFNVLGEIWQLQGQSFLWVEDLSTSDRFLDLGVQIPYFGSYLNLLPVVMGAVTILSTWLSARTVDSRRKPSPSLFGIGILFFVLFYSFPAALVLYWLASNVFQLLQQLVVSSLTSKPVS